MGYSQVGIGTTTPAPGSILDVTSTDKGILVPRVNITNLTTIAPITGGSPAGLLVWNTNTATGIGFHCWDGNNWAVVGASASNVDNGLNYNIGADRVRLGGDLLENTTIPQNAFQMTYNLNGTGDFNIQDNGTTRFQVLDNGRIEMSNNTDASGALNTGVLEIANSLRLDGNEIITNTNAALFLNNDNNGDVRVDGNTLQVDASANRVGIRTTAPDYDLDVAGSIGHNDYMYHNDDADTYWRFSDNDQIQIRAGDARMMDMVEGGTDYVVFNENSTDIDFRIESNNQVNQFFVDGGSNRIGIRTNAPSSFFEMTNGGENVTTPSMARFTNTSNQGVGLVVNNSSAANQENGFVGITNYSGNTAFPSGVYGEASSNSVTHTAIGVVGFSNGNTGIGVLGSRNGGGGAGFGGLFFNDLGYTGGFFNISDRKTKKNLNEIKNALSIVNQLNPVSYKFDQKKYPNMGLNTEKEYGFVAQEVRKILPEITRIKKININAAKEVKPNEEQVETDVEAFVMLDYTRLIPILTKAIKEQQEVINDQEKRLKTLESKMERILNKK